GMVLFVTDTGNYRIRRIVVASASVTTVAQTPYCYYLCISRDGSSLFVTTDLTVVRINTSTGVSVTLAGGTSRGSIDGINATARFNVARGIALNRDETALIVADNNNNLVRRLELSSNNVSTIAGSTTSGLMDGPGLAARFYFPFGGNWYCNKTSLLCGLLVADRDNGAIRFVAVELTNEATSSSSILMSPTRSFSTTTSFDSKSSTMPLSTSLSVSQSVTDASGSITGSCSSRFTRSFSGSPSTTQSGTALSGNMTLSLSISNSESFLVLTSRSQKSLSNSDTKLSSDVASSSFSGSCSKTQSLSSLSLTSRTVILFSETFTLANQMKAQRPSDTVVGAVSATAAIGALGGDPSSSISLVMLALLTCSHDPPVSVATYFVSLFFGLGNVAMALGNIG
ncbi:fibronectin type III domain-containing protein, putative, partial [Bodo saltans]